MNEIPVVFESSATPLIGMLHPARGNPELGVLVMVAGGPQYRIGGHRQLVLWARKFAAQGFPVFRFDFRGMGDSYGTYVGYENAEDDIRAAIDKFFLEFPSLKSVVLWGECNACSASLFYAHKDPRVQGIVMLNPWVRTEQGQARAVVKHYYLHRLTERSFWTKVFTLKFNVIGSIRSALGMISKARGVANSAHVEDRRPLPERMLEGLTHFRGRIMMVMSGRDLVPKEFDDLVAQRPAWQEQLAARQTERHELPFADHTFSSGEWRDQVAVWGIDWLQGLYEEHMRAQVPRI
jgi:exosortase A-associated hydrolase 1